MNRPQLAPVPTPPQGRPYPPDLPSWAGEVNRALKALSDELARHAAAFQQAIEGQGINRGVVTLTANAASTTVTGSFIPAGAGVLLFPRTANAAAEVGNGTIYVAATTKGQFVITHANNAQADRTFTYLIVVAD